MSHRHVTGAISMSRDELIHRREDVLAEVGMTYEVLHERALAFSLRPPEREAYETIRSIQYLLGETS